MSLVDHQQRAVFQGQRAQASMETGIGKYHAGIGHHGFSQDGGDIALGERRLNRA